MTEIDIYSGKFYLNGQCFKTQIDSESTDSQTVGKNSYSNTSLNGVISNIPFKATGYYKNKKLKSISLTIESEYLKANYHPPKDIDSREYLTPYVDFWENLTEGLMNELLNTVKRKFAWGKVQVQVDPRGPTVYGEVKYR
ncbi:hypothetical protein [Flagellimonas myxillae]|uniref:hypothetical protein n=1 Tax=Flagellimonas myxillae TaxID=2942214 RepID=UPI00201E8478|nr:hypothetical protein [Muricauda myxillae]MCL6267204.1 hypothetical protein [Muricauda myxillae]